jgi:hypothetical protein
MAMNGISNGWIYDKVEDTCVFLASTKIDRLCVLLEEIHAEGQKVVIWCAYHNDINRIAEAIELKYDLQFFTSLDTFDPSQPWDFVLATEAMGASVNFFKDIKYAIYFSINYKYLDLQQSMARHERKGSKHAGAHYYFLQTIGSPDIRAYYLVTQSKLKEEEIINELIKL